MIWKPLLAACLCLLAGRVEAATPATKADEAAAIDFAYRYALPIYEFTRAQTKPFNTLTHRRSLADSSTRAVTTPNNDTLYSSALLDLSAGPVGLEIPAFGRRYHSLALIDAYTNNAEILGTRTTGVESGRFLIVGPGWAGEAPSGVRVIRSPTPQALLLVRILVDGPDDLAAVHALQDAIHLIPPGPVGPAPAPVPLPASGETFVTVVNRAMALNPPPSADQPVLKRLGQVGIGPQAVPFSRALRAAWTRQFPLSRAALIKETETQTNVVDGWSYSDPAIGVFGTRYDLRAAVALRGLLALPQVEAVYTIPAADSTGAPLDGGHRYRLHLPAGAPPVKAFWSLSAYEVVDSGALFFADNPIHRYSVGDRTPGLARNPDGSLDILIQSEPPAERANWLPVGSGRFVLAMRAYLPEPALIDGSFRYPPLERID